MKPIFGEKEQKELKFKKKKDTRTSFPPVKFALCVSCAKKITKKEYEIVQVFTRICNDCKDRFCNVVNKTMTIRTKVEII